MSSPLVALAETLKELKQYQIQMMNETSDMSDEVDELKQQMNEMIEDHEELKDQVGELGIEVEDVKEYLRKSDDDINHRFTKLLEEMATLKKELEDLRKVKKEEILIS